MQSKFYCVEQNLSIISYGTGFFFLLRSCCLVSIVYLYTIFLFLFMCVYVFFGCYYSETMHGRTRRLLLVLRLGSYDHSNTKYSRWTSICDVVCCVRYCRSIIPFIRSLSLYLCHWDLCIYSHSFHRTKCINCVVCTFVWLPEVSMYWTGMLLLQLNGQFTLEAIHLHI